MPTRVSLPESRMDEVLEKVNAVRATCRRQTLVVCQYAFEPITTRERGRKMHRVP